MVGGDDPEYTGQWPQWQWQAAATMFAAFPDDAAPGVAYELLPNRVLPEWLRRTVTGRASVAFEVMAPACCLLWAETLDWFALAAEHPDVLDPPAPLGYRWDYFATPAGLHAAWNAARDHSSTPVLMIELAPGGTEADPRVEVGVYGFYIVSPDTADHDAAVATIARLLLTQGGQPYQFNDGTHVAEAAGTTPGRVHAWEWV